MKRLIAFLYGIACYALFLGVFLYLVGFLGDFVVPKTIDAPATTLDPVLAAIVDLGLVLVFGLQHSVMARPGFKRVWTRIVPRVVERSTYVLLSSLLLGAMFWAWQPLTGELWRAHGVFAEAIGWSVFWSGFGLVLVSTFLIDHFDLFGLKQVTLNLVNRLAAPPSFQVRYLYRFVRHPLYVGWMLAFWGAPVMTVGHALFAAAMSAYMLVAIRFEERDLTEIHGAPYARYQGQVPMLVPRPGHVHPGVVPSRANGTGVAKTARA